MLYFYCLVLFVWGDCTLVYVTLFTVFRVAHVGWVHEVVLGGDHAEVDTV